MNAAAQGRKPTRKEKHDAALTSAAAKVKKKGVKQKSLGEKIRDALKGNA